MKRLTTILLMVAAGLGCAARDPRPPHGLTMKAYSLPAAPAVLPVATFASVETDVEGLQATIGRYPPRFDSEEHRDEIYARWSAALVAARSLDAWGDGR
jgi:hypothetical protein